MNAPFPASAPASGDAAVTDRPVLNLLIAAPRGFVV